MANFKSSKVYKSIFSYAYKTKFRNVEKRDSFTYQNQIDFRSTNTTHYTPCIFQDHLLALVLSLKNVFLELLILPKRGSAASSWATRATSTRKRGRSRPRRAGEGNEPRLIVNGRKRM